jgi:hypothetical protein
MNATVEHAIVVSLLRYDSVVGHPEAVTRGKGRSVKSLSRSAAEERASWSMDRPSNAEGTAVMRQASR